MKILKAFARWLYMNAYREELLAVKRRVKRLELESEDPSAQRLTKIMPAMEVSGTLDTLTELDLLA